MLTCYSRNNKGKEENNLRKFKCLCSAKLTSIILPNACMHKEELSESELPWFKSWMPLFCAYQLILKYSF
jgi:hypothetical protein